MDDIRPYIFIPFLLFCMIYVTYQSCPQMNMSSTNARILSAACFGNKAPFGCTLTLEYYQQSTLTTTSITGSYQQKYRPYDDIEVWVGNNDPNNVMIERGWSKEGLTLLFILFVATLLYVFSLQKKKAI